MESTDERQRKLFDREEPGVFPAMLTCVAGVVGIVMVAAGPWFVLTWYW